MSNPAPEQQDVVDNLTTRQNLVRQHTGLDSLPGYTVVVFEKPDRGGEIFYRLMQPGERFQSKLRLPFWDPTRGYFAVAVNRAVLNHSFDRPVSLDDHVHKFILSFHLKYRAADPQRVAELREQDPLRQLRDELARVIVRSCTRRKWEMVRDRFSDLEMVVLNGERAGLVRYAATLGLEIVSVELDRRLPEDDEEVRLALSKRQAEIGVQRVRVEKDAEKQIFEATQAVETIKARASQQGQLRDSLTKAASTALGNVADGVNSPREFEEAFDVVRKINETVQSEPAPSHPNAISSGIGDVKALGTGEDKAGALLLHTAMEINRLTCPHAQKRSLRSAILHVVAEALLDDHADEEMLRKYAEQVSEVGKKLQPPLTPSQFRFFETFTKYEQLRNALR